MSGAKVAIVTPGAGRRAALASAPTRSRPAVRLTAFALLGIYGVVRWATLIKGREDAPLLGLLTVALLLAVGGTAVARRSRLLVVALVVIAFVALFPLAGFPLAWVVHVRLAVTADAVERGLSALPRVLVPYEGLDPWVRAVMLLGAGVLLIDGAVMLVLVPVSMQRLREAGAALPLLALAAVPAALVHPQLAYLDGALLLGMLALLLWCEHIPPDRGGAAAGLLVLATVAAMTIAPSLDRHRPWLDFQALASKLQAPAERFDWTQGYGPIPWPRNGHTVLEVKASRADYWKTENLDAFGGRGWSEAKVPPSDSPVAGVPAALRRRWTQTLQVSLDSISTPEVIAAGSASAPSGLSSALVPGLSPGTWLAGQTLGTGDSYQVRVYDPRPSAAELSAAGTDFPHSILSSELTVEVPVAVSSSFATTRALVPVLMPAFGSGPSGGSRPGRNGPSAVLEASPYAGAYAISRTLEAGARTPFAYAVAIMRFLSRGYSYSQNPPPARYPLESFLVSTKIGYCQQFAGAMALLLRLGGVPARVAVGFTTGNYDSGSGRWVVSDLDAHAWVEVFFPRYGWVRFDPTPSSDSAPAGQPAGTATGTGATPRRAPAHRRTGSVSTRKPTVSARAPESSGLPLGIWLAIAAVAGAVGLVAWLTAPLRTPHARLRELERAFARAGRPLHPAETLWALEGRLSSWTVAAGYIRALRLERFGGDEAGSSPAGRRALRRSLAAELGPFGRLRALWALPPRRG